MLNTDLFGTLEKIDFTVNARRERDLNAVTITANKGVLAISAKLIRELGWEEGTRLDLYNVGTLFVLKPAKAGLATLKFAKASTWKQAKIYSKNMCLEILSRCRSNRFFEGEVQDGMLLFRPKEGENK